MPAPSNNLLSKLGFVPNQPFLVLNFPENFQPLLKAMRNASADFNHASAEKASFALVFVTSVSEVEQTVASVLPGLEPDARLWFAYVKKSSALYACGITRDSGWQSLGAAGFEGVTQISLDDDWSAIRFRHVHFIKSLKRDASRALSAEGRSRTKAAKHD